MNESYKDITPQELGTFIRGILEVLSTCDTDNPSNPNNVHYKKIDSNRGIISYALSRGNPSLIFQLPLSFNVHQIQYNKYLLYKNGTLIIDNEYYRYSASEFEEDRFSLSTVLDPVYMYYLECGTYFNDMVFDKFVLSFFMPNIINYYKLLHGSTL